jgi:hypothetical protein
METTLNLRKFIFNKRIVLIVLVLFLLGVNRSNAQTSQNFQTITYEIFLPGNTRDMPEDMLGFNGQNTFDASSTWNAMYVGNSNIFNLSPSTLRYPGGTVANFWDWRKGGFLNKSEFTEDIELPASYKDRPVFNNKENGINNYFLTCVKNNSTPLLDFNILSSNFHYQLGSLYEAKSVGFNKFYIELGNEFYIGLKENRKVFPTVQQYLKRAITWASNIKGGSYPPFSNIKLAVVGAESTESNPGRRRLWLNNVLKEVTNMPGIDAVTVHIYLDSKIADIANHYNTSGASLQCCDGGNGNPEVIFKEGILNAFQDTKEIVQDEIAAIGRANKEAWITEYNMLNNDKSVAVNGSWFHGMFVAAMTMEMLKNPTITKIMPHTLIGDAIFSGLFNDANGLQYGVGTEYTDPIEAGCIASTSTVQYDRTALGIAVSPIADAVRGSIKSRPLIIKVKGTNNDPSYLSSSVNEYFDLQGMQFDKNDGRIEYIIMNFSGNSSANRDLDFSSLIPLNSTAEYNVFMSDNPFNFTIGDPQDINGTHSNDNAYCFPSYQTLNSPYIISLPKYSILHVRVLPNLIERINIESAKLCCNASHTYSVPKELWKEGWHWQIEGLELSNNNPYYVNASDFIGTGKKEVKLFDQNGRLLGSSDIEILACPAKPEIVVDNNIGITTQEFCPNDPMTFNLTIKSGTTLPNPSSYSYLWIATGEFSTPHGATTAFTPPKTGTDVYLIATDGTCWVKSDAITFQSLIPQVEIVVGTSSNSHTIENGILRVCANRTDDIEFTYLNNDPNWPSGYSINDSWSVCGSPLPSAIITSSQTLDNFCQLNLETVVVGSTMSCTSNTYVNLLTEDCCSSASHSLDPIAGNLMHPNIDELYHYLQTNCSTCSLNYAGTGNARSLEVTNTSSSFVMTINGLFEVDGDLTLNNCNINMGPNALIKLIGNNKLNLVNCIVNECGINKPWDGIVADDDRQYLSITGDAGTSLISSISGAKTAIDLSDNAEFLIANTNFSNNQVNISIHDCATNIPQRKDAVTSNPFSGYIYGNKFQSDVTRMNLLFGLVNLTHGIYLNSLDRVIIGENEQTLANNLFNRCEIGVISNDASVTYFGNNFNEIYRPTTTVNKDFSAAIASRNTSSYNDSKIIIGDEIKPSLSRNKFDNCAVSIDITGDLELGVFNNYFDQINSMPLASNNILDIYIKNTNFSNIKIKNNKFKYVHKGIYIYKLLNNSNVEIWNNEFLNQQTPSIYEDFSNSAIVIDNQLKNSNTSVSINENSITNLRRGVFCRNQDNLIINGSSTTPFILSYNASTAVIKPTVGIEVVNSYNMRLLNNFISKNAYTSSSFATVTGIKLVGTIGMVGCNNISNMGYALSLSGTCVGTNIRENVFNAFDAGVYRYAGSQIGIQGGSGDPTNNSWIDPPNSIKVRLDGDNDPFATSVDWYFTGISGSALDPRVNYKAFLYNPSFTTQTISSNYCTRNNQLSLRRQDIDAAIDGQQAMDDLDAAYVVKKNLYTLVHQDSIVGLDSLINTNVVQDLISDIEAGPMDEFINIDNLLTNKPDSQLLGYIQSIPVSWQSDVYKQQVNRILLKEIEKKPWDAQDSIWLDFIASIPRNIGGEAVFSACAALKRECAEQNISSSTNRIAKNIELEKSGLIIYPNPAKESIIVNLENKEDILHLLTIYDITGRVINTLSFNGKGPVTIPIKELESGLYKIEVISSNNNRTYSTFVKQ